MSSPILHVDLHALAHNWRQLEAAARPASLAAVVKADAYGLGIAGIAPKLADLGARQFFVAHHGEAKTLRKILPDQAIEIMVLNGLADKHIAETLALGITPVLNAPEEITLWRQATHHLSVKPAAALQVDTGMNRLGVEPDPLLALDPLDDLNLRWIMSHLAVADSPDHPLNAAQIECFKSLCAHAPRAGQSLLNSSGLVQLDGPRFDLVRPGIALYGGLMAGTCDLKPVARLTAPILTVRDVTPGESVGYAAQFRAERQSRIATISLGYADGYPRSLGDKAHMWLIEAEAFVPVIGRVSMDLITLDVTHIPEHLARRGMRVEAYGQAVSLEALARMADTISYEILTRTAGRVSRSYIGQ